MLHIGESYQKQTYVFGVLIKDKKYVKEEYFGFGVFDYIINY